MQRFYLVVLLSLLGSVTAWSAPDAALTRAVKGQTITSPTLPAATLTITHGLQYLGGQHFFLSGMTDVEQYFFVDAAPDKSVRRWLWIQFEHKTPGEPGAYNYTPAHTTMIGGLTFVYDSKIYTDYAGVKPAPASDVEHARALIAAHGLTLPKTAMRIRMFNDPGTDHRSELMVIYLQAVPPGAIPADASNEDVMEGKYPALSQTILRNVKKTLAIQPR